MQNDNIKVKWFYTKMSLKYKRALVHLWSQWELHNKLWHKDIRQCLKFNTSPSETLIAVWQHKYRYCDDVRLDTDALLDRMDQ